MAEQQAAVGQGATAAAAAACYAGERRQGIGGWRQAVHEAAACWRLFFAWNFSCAVGLLIFRSKIWGIIGDELLFPLHTYLGIWQTTKFREKI